MGSARLGMYVGSRVVQGKQEGLVASAIAIGLLNACVVATGADQGLTVRADKV